MFIHEHHPASVRQVADHFAKSRGLVRTTALNVMTRLCKKGFLVRKKIEGLFYYSPKVQRTALLRDLVGNFVREMLGGSVSPFVAYLAEAGVTEEQLAELRKIVAEHPGRQEKQP